MAGNQFGKLFSVTSFGESHGAAIGGVIDGCPAGISLDLSAIQQDLDRRKPGQSAIVTQRKEPDEVTFTPVYLKEKPQVLPSASLSTTPIKSRTITATSKTVTVLRMPTMYMTRNTAFAITAGVGEVLPVKPLAV